MLTIFFAQYECHLFFDACAYIQDTQGKDIILSVTVTTYANKICKQEHN